ncbi:MAG: AAA family ATPase [Nitrospirota bacterium]
MISKINKIKNLGLLLNSYSWNSHLTAPSQLDNFKRYNLFYGWNGSGKTTLSRLFSAIEVGELNDNLDLEYEVEDMNGHVYKNGEKFNQNIRVFNHDYIENNLEIKHGKAKAITLVLGDVNRAIVKQIEDDETSLKEKKDNHKKVKESLDHKIKTKGYTFTAIAKTIYVLITGGAVRTYRKDHAENDFTNLTRKELLDKAEFDNIILIVKQNSKPIIEKIEEIEINFDGKESKKLSLAIQSLISSMNTLLAQTVESQIIDRLKDHDDISSWVEMGINIHEKYKSTNCEFCRQSLPENLLFGLSKHFNEADKKLKRDIDNLMSNLDYLYKSVDNIKAPDKARLYDELQDEYGKSYTIFNTEKSGLLKVIEEVKRTLENKRFKTTESVILDTTIDMQSFMESLNVIASYVNQHNKKTSDFDSEKKVAISKLKNHFLSTIFDEVKLLNKEIQDCEDKIKIIVNGDETSGGLGINALNKRIADNQAKISSTHKACKDINTGLAIFLGRDELFFEPHRIKAQDEHGNPQELDDGYVIKRNGKPAINLSEGEKTAIAFVYFTIHLKDQNFDLSKGIVVIDDPVSSLDSNSLFQAFAFLKNAVKNAEQIFIFTHNFDFLRLLLNWVKNDDHGKKARYYMLKNYYNINQRQAYIDNMDIELSTYESEYHYLFKILKEFKSNGTIAQAYPIPNIARKVLETFLMFRVPNNKSSFQKIQTIRETTNYDENKLTAIYKFTNDQSHITGSGFNPALVQETQKSVEYLLEMIEAVFPEHYKILLESIN